MITRTLPITKLFKNLSRFDKVLLFGGTTSAILAGIILPSISIFMGNIAITFSGE
jgi:hypothetical protein